MLCTPSAPEGQIIGVLKEAEADAKTADLVRRHGVPEATIYGWKAKYNGLEISEARRLRELESENAKLKRLLADTMPDKGSAPLHIRSPPLNSLASINLMSCQARGAVGARAPALT